MQSTRKNEAQDDLERPASAPSFFLSLGSVLSLTLLCAFLFFYRLADRDLWSSHEARAGMNAQTILDDGDWLVPHLYDGQPEMQKPPLYYWLVALVARMRGGQVDAWAVRLPAALAAAGCVAMLVLLGRGRGRPMAGILAGVILATALHFTWLARIGRTDMPLTLCVTIAVVMWNLELPFLAFIGIAAGVLMKGPLAVVLPLGILVFQALSQRILGYAAADNVARAGRRSLFAPRPASLFWGIPLILALTLPWFLAAQLQTRGELFRVFIWHHNIERGFGGSLLRGHPWWFYGPQFFIDFQPWSAAILAAGFWCWRRRWWQTDPELRFGCAWFLAVTVMLSLFRFKRADYLLPAYPGAAWFLGCVGARALASWKPIGPTGAPARLAILGLLVAVAMAAGWAWKVKRSLPEEETCREYRSFAARIRQAAPAPAPIIFFRTEAHPLAFHVGRPLSVFLEWERLREQLGRPGPNMVILPARWLEESLQQLSGIRLEQVALHPHLAGPPSERPLVLVRASPKEEP